MEVILKPGGSLFGKQWSYDEKTCKGEYVYEDISDDSFEYLYENVTLLNVTLNDIFVLTERCSDVYRTIFRRNYYEEIIKEVNSGDGPLEDKEVEYLEIYKYLDIMEIEDKVHESNLCVSFHGVNKTTDTNYSLMFSSAKLLKNLPLYLKSDISIFEEKYVPDYTFKEQTFPSINYTLFEVLNAVFWELSFAGSAEDRDALLKTLDERVEEITENEGL